ncbi:MAG: L-arabinose isomerase [Clostridiales bacterium]|nr:L-arabinose isomerase [Clostridiales bacterium]
MKNYTFWFAAGSQHLYGGETLRQVEENCRAIADGLNGSGRLPYPVAYKMTVKTAEDAARLTAEANADGDCAGIITFCHTFSPSKMWINGLARLRKPYLHFHTQFHREIPDDAIDMDYMNLHQSAHGDREHGFIGTRMRLPRKVIAGYWRDAAAQERIGQWMRSAAGAVFSEGLKVTRFGDNMRGVAVTEGDKVEAQIRLGWQVNTVPVGRLTEVMAEVSDAEIAEKMAEYREKYDFAPSAEDAAAYQAREEIAIQRLLDAEGCAAFTNTFEDLYGMRQLPGLATQNLMSRGYGYGGEGDWKTAALTAVLKAMGGVSSFMEDYTYDLKRGLILGAHMLEVCPCIAADRPRVEVHPLGIGGKEPPARLIFEGKAGRATVSSLVDMGGRLRLITQDVECVKPPLAMPRLPVARVMWKPSPNLETGAESWILAGGAHHTVLSYDCGAELLRDWARIIGAEFVHIGENTTPHGLEQELFWNDLAWKLK